MKVITPERLAKRQEAKSHREKALDRLTTLLAHDAIDSAEAREWFALILRARGTVDIKAISFSLALLMSKGGIEVGA